MDAAVVKTNSTKADVFIEYQAHVNKIGVQINKCGWSYGVESDYKKEIWFGHKDEKTTLEQLKEIHMEILKLR